MDGTYFYLYVKTDCASTTTIFKYVPKEMVQQMEALLDSMPEITRKWNGVSQHTFSLNGAEPSLNPLRLPSSAELSMMAAPPAGAALTMMQSPKEQHFQSPYDLGDPAAKGWQKWNKHEIKDEILQKCNEAGVPITEDILTPGFIQDLYDSSQPTSEILREIQVHYFKEAILQKCDNTYDSAYTSDDEEDQCTFSDSDEGAPPLQSESESEEKKEEDRDNGRLFYLPECEEVGSVQYTKAAQTTAKGGFKIYKLDPGRQQTEMSEYLGYVDNAETKATSRQLRIQTVIAQQLSSSRCLMKWCNRWKQY
jgi:hypothetical protein